MFAVSALQMGGSGDDLRQSAPAMIRLSGVQFAQFNPALMSYVNAVADFVGKGGELRISAQPSEPIGFMELQSASLDPQSLPETLNIEITHKE